MFFDKEKRGVTLYCFSPPVVLATFLIEVFLACYAWWRYRSTRSGRLAVVFLFLLAGFQLSEYMICLGQSASLWAKIGFICTAFLPIMGIDFIFELRHARPSLVWGYALATAFSFMFVLYPGVLQSASCTGAFVAFDSRVPTFDFIYPLYYLVTLFIGIGLIMEVRAKKSSNQRALNWLLVGYLLFMIPTLAVYILSDWGQAAIASVLCGFAVLLALVIALRVLPLVHPKR